MPVLSQRTTGSTVIAENTDNSLNWGAGSGVRERIAAPAVQDRCTQPQIRMGKVLAIRQQLAEGTYDLAKRLNVVLDRLLKKLNA